MSRTMKLLWVLIVIAVMVEALHLPKNDTACIPQGSYCMDSIKPCCQVSNLRDGRIIHDAFVCFIFGQGLCQPLALIPRIEVYVSLVSKLDSSNYLEMRREYRIPFGEQ
nr:c111.1 [Tranosema rostrale ichnovirus]